MKKLEFRTQSIELRAEDEGLVVEGLVNPSGQESKVLYGEFTEVIEKGAFQRALDRKDRDVKFLYNHAEDEMPLASTKSGSLELFEDETGLRMKASIVPTTKGRDIYTLIKHNLADSFSFGFRVLKDTWDNTGDTLKRYVNELELFEVSVLSVEPAYNDTYIMARSLDASEIIPEDIHIEEKIEEVIEDKQEDIVTEEVANDSCETTIETEATQNEGEEVIDEVVITEEEPKDDVTDENVKKWAEAVLELLKLKTE